MHDVNKIFLRNKSTILYHAKCLSIKHVQAMFFKYFLILISWVFNANIRALQQTAFTLLGESTEPGSVKYEPQEGHNELWI